MPRVRTASAIFLTRGDGEDLELYLVERAPELRFFGGYWAAPGGVLEEGDKDGHDDELKALQACALRELFEETGVLLPPMAVSDRDDARQKLLDGDASVWRDLGPADLDAARPFCHITTPDFAPVRYATQFVQIALPEGESPTIVPGELTRGRFWKPREALDAFTRGEMLIVPPVRYLLKLMVGNTLEAFFEQARKGQIALEKGRLHDIYFTPGIFLGPLKTKTLPPSTTTNCFLVGTGPFYIVDPGSDDEIQQARIFLEIQERIDTGQRPAGVLLTHHHPDHIGGVSATCQRYEIPVFAHSRTLREVDAGLEARPLDDGDRLELGEAPDGSGPWHLEVIHTPGHADGHLTFVESRYNAALAGDLLSLVSTIVIDPPEGHLRTYLDSLRKLLDRPIGFVYPAHGPAFRDGHGLIQHFLSHREDREKALIAALGEGMEEVEALVASVYADVDPRLHALAARSLTAGLIKLREDGVATSDDDVRWRLCGSGSGA